jgi:hypothetical protein
MNSIRNQPKDFVLSKRSEAELVVAHVIDVLKRYEIVSLADLYDLMGLESSYTDTKWGWTRLNNVQIHEVTNGFTIEFPPLEEI